MILRWTKNATAKDKNLNKELCRRCFITFARPVNSDKDWKLVVDNTSFVLYNNCSDYGELEKNSNEHVSENTFYLLDYIIYFNEYSLTKFQYINFLHWNTAWKCSKDAGGISSLYGKRDFVMQILLPLFWKK